METPQTWCSLEKTGILILIYVCAQNSCRICKIFFVHHQNRQYILLFGTKTVYWFLQRTLGLLWFWVLWRVILNIHAIILSCLRKNHWSNFVSEHPMIFSMFCHQTFVSPCSAGPITSPNSIQGKPWPCSAVTPKGSSTNSNPKSTGSIPSGLADMLVGAAWIQQLDVP